MVKIKWFIIFIFVSFFVGFFGSFTINFFYGRTKLIEAKKLIDSANNDLAISKQTNNELETKLAGLNDNIKRLTEQINRGLGNAKELDNTISNAKNINDECRKLIDEILTKNP